MSKSHSYSHSSNPVSKLRAMSDAVLMEQASRGIESATRSIVQQHLSYVRAVAFRLLRDIEEVEDVAQEVFLKLWKQSASWKPQAKISTWLYTVTRNHCLDRTKKKKPILNNELLENTAVNQVEPIDEQVEEQRTQLKKVLPLLSEKYQQVILLFYYDNLKIKQAALQLNLTEDAYESLLRRARKKLKKLLIEIK